MTTKRKVMNVFEAILKYGHDEDFVPVGGEDFMATDAPAGSDEKIDVPVAVWKWACRCGTAKTAAITRA